MRIAKWDIWVCGSGYENPTDPNYTTTTQIIAGVRALGTKVFGYVTVGGPPLATLAQIQQNVTWWDNIGVDGIFFDSCGFDFTGVTRSLQIGAKQAAQSYNLPVAWNAYYFEHVAADTITQVTWPSSSSRYSELSQRRIRRSRRLAENGLGLCPHHLHGFLVELEVIHIAVGWIGWKGTIGITTEILEHVNVPDRPWERQIIWVPCLKFAVPG